jgi:hypothetical protein
LPQRGVDLDRSHRWSAGRCRRTGDRQLILSRQPAIDLFFEKVVPLQVCRRVVGSMHRPASAKPREKDDDVAEIYHKSHCTSSRSYQEKMHRAAAR